MSLLYGNELTACRVMLGVVILCTFCGVRGLVKRKWYAWISAAAVVVALISLGIIFPQMEFSGRDVREEYLLILVVEIVCVCGISVAGVFAALCCPSGSTKKVSGSVAILDEEGKLRAYCRFRETSRAIRIVKDGAHTSFTEALFARFGERCTRITLGNAQSMRKGKQGLAEVYELFPNGEEGMDEETVKSFVAEHAWRLMVPISLEIGNSAWELFP